jgi:hypothetical protein
MRNGDGGDMTRRYATDRPSGAPVNVPEYPSRSWYSRPTFLGDDEGFVILDSGRIAGRLFDHGLASTLVRRGETYVPTPSPTGFAAFHTGRVVCADGRDLAVGSLTLGHPDGTGDPAKFIATARAGVDDRGVWISGSLTPNKGTRDVHRFDGDRITVSDLGRLRACGISGSWRPMTPEWWEAHGHTAAMAKTDTELVSVALVTGRGLPLPGKGKGRPRLTQTAALDAADQSRSAALSDVLRCQEVLARAQERARAAAVAVVRPDPNAWRARAAAIRIQQRAGMPFNPGPEQGTLDRAQLVTALRRVQTQQVRLGIALERLRECDLASSLELIDALPASLQTAGHSR